jgi:hypothetical protein
VTGLDKLIVSLIDHLPEDAGGHEAGVRVEIESVDLAIPIEARLDATGMIRASLPRGRLATGYDAVLCRMAVRYARMEVS